MPEETTSRPTESELRKAIGCAITAKAGFTAASALAAGIVVLVLLALMERIAVQLRDQDIVVSALAMFCLDHRVLVAVVPAVAALVCAVAAMTVRRGKLLLLALALLVLVGQVAVAVASLVTLIAPLYQVQEL